MAGTKLNNNFNLAQSKPLDERTATVLTVADLSAMRYPYPNLRKFVAGTINKWYEFKLVLGTYVWVADGATTSSFRDLIDLPTINGHIINGELTLEELEIQPKGNYLTDLYLGDYYKKEETLSAEEIVQGFPTKTYVNEELGKKISSAVGYRLISTEEATKIGESASKTELGTLEGKVVHKDTTLLPTLAPASFNKNSTEVIRLFDETKQIELKINLSTLFTSPTYSTYKTLEGTQDGINSQFKYRGTLIQETAELYIGALLYPVNIGFTFEGEYIIITGAPIPKADDVMRLKAIYLT